MEHFSDLEWADFVRGMDVPNPVAMTSHMTECRDCSNLVSALRLVGDVSHRDAITQPPDHAVYSARAIFAMWTPKRVGLFSPINARLVFDSFATPALAGIRSGQPMCRQLLYEATPFAIDLRLDHVRDQHRVLLTGQVVSTDMTRAVSGVSVKLIDDGERIVEQIRTNTAGEFYLAYQPAPRLQLRVDVDSQPRINLPSDVIVTDGDREFGED